MRVNYFGPSPVGGASETVPASDGLCLLQGFLGLRQISFHLTDQPPSSWCCNLRADFLLILVPHHLKLDFT